MPGWSECERRCAWKSWLKMQWRYENIGTRMSTSENKVVQSKSQNYRCIAIVFEVGHSSGHGRRSSSEIAWPYHPTIPTATSAFLVMNTNIAPLSCRADDDPTPNHSKSCYGRITCWIKIMHITYILVVAALLMKKPTILGARTLYYLEMDSELWKRARLKKNHFESKRNLIVCNVDSWWTVHVSR